MSRSQQTQNTPKSHRYIAIPVAPPSFAGDLNTDGNHKGDQKTPNLCSRLSFTCLVQEVIKIDLQGKKDTTQEGKGRSLPRQLWRSKDLEKHIAAEGGREGINKQWMIDIED
ncbi:unnamed protein product [Lactuca saligna]|uniref:Uncharacterized protein n=1 Tax=Lactuca saligna TaxID=75948 RepID=A0AA36E0I0_LACSI|nr:unnamed protein product [Lactuca saligna]